MLGATKTLKRMRDYCGMEKEDDRTEVIGSKSLFLTMIDEEAKRRGRVRGS
jgi:hypothetical protein